MAIDIIVVDDDPMVGDVTTDLLSELGYKILLIRDSHMVVSSIREHQPRLVLLDILMPGTDGLSLLKELRSDPGLAQLKIAVLSGKAFATEVERARNLGADAFIQKPFDVKGFPGRISDLIGPPPQTGRVSPSKSTAQVRVWGKAEADSTPCVSVETMDRIFIFDAGRGIVPLGERILAEGRHREAWLMLSHFHPDHVSGLGEFPCLKSKDFSLHVLGPKEPDQSLSALFKEALARTLKGSPKSVTARLSLHELQEETYTIAPGLRLKPFYANHPTTTLGFTVETGGLRVVYCPDSELYGEAATAMQDYDERLGRICAGADLLIHDGRYSAEDHPRHLNQGHSSALAAASFALEHEVQRLILIHQDPSYSEAKLQALETAARAVLEAKGGGLPCWFARDGLKLDI